MNVKFDWTVWFCVDEWFWKDVTVLQAAHEHYLPLYGAVGRITRDKTFSNTSEILRDKTIDVKLIYVPKNKINSSSVH